MHQQYKYTSGTSFGMHLQVAAARTPWAAVSAWSTNTRGYFRHYTSKQDEPSTAAESKADAGKEQQAAGSIAGREDAEQVAAGGQEAVDEGTATTEELQGLLTKAQEDVSACASYHMHAVSWLCCGSLWSAGRCIPQRCCTFCSSLVRLPCSRRASA